MKYIFTSPLPEASATAETNSLGQQLAELGLLGEDASIVESISSEAADLTLEGHIRWGEAISTRVARELDELADSSLPQLPLFRRGERYGNQGYYEIASADVEPMHANDHSVWTYTLTLRYVGKRGSHFRSVAVNVRDTIHPFGNDTAVLVGVPASARKVSWYDDEAGETAPATAVSTVSGQNVDIDLYDVDAGAGAVATDLPTIIYEVGYDDDVRAGARVYDTEGNAEKFSAGGDGPRQWQIVHVPDHDIDDPVVVSNGLLRVTLDEFDAPGELVAETWDDTAGEWTDVGLVNGSDWVLYDVDVTQAGMIDVRAQLEFEHPDEGLFDLNVSLQRGRESLLCEIPDGEDGPIPSGIETWLDPIAAEWIYDPQPAKGLTRKRDVGS